MRRAPTIQVACQKSPYWQSSVSRRPARRRYHTLATSSRVDETLFGPAHREVDHGTRCRGTAELWIDEGIRLDERKPSRVQHVTKDLVRDLILPSKDPSGNSTILNCNEFQRIQQAAHVITPEEHAAAAEKVRLEKEQLMTESEARRNKVKVMDRHRVKNEKLSDLEQEHKFKNDSLQRKAMQQLQENEEEIKRLNQLTMEAKVHMVRDAQCTEKEAIKKEVGAEQKRLDDEMEVDRVNAIRIEEEIARKRKNERMIGAMMIMDQIKHNEQEKLLELERKDHENKTVLEYIEHICEEEMKGLDKNSQKKKMYREELDKCLEDNSRRKGVRAEQDKMLNERVVQQRKELDDRRAALEEEQARIRREKDVETERMRTLQERAIDVRVEQDALRAKRGQEQTEREWRRKEEMLAVQRAQNEEMIKKARVRQQEEKQHLQAIEAQRDRADFEHMLKAHQEVIDQKGRQTDVRRKKQREFRAGIIQQISEKQEQRIQERRARYQEGVKLEEQAKMRRQMLEEAKIRKLNELRMYGIDEKYVRLIDQKVKHMKFA